MAKSSKTSERFNVSVPENVLACYRSCQSMKNFTAFARIAIIEKLNRDFGFSLDASMGDCSQGKRVDLMDSETRQRKLPLLREQAKKARKGRRSHEK